MSSREEIRAEWARLRREWSQAEQVARKLDREVFAAFKNRDGPSAELLAAAETARTAAALLSTLLDEHIDKVFGLDTVEVG